MIFSRACCTLRRRRPGDGGRVGLAGDLVHFVDVDDAPGGLLHVVIRHLEQVEDDVLHILAHIARFRQGGGVGNVKGTFNILARVWASRVLPEPVGADEQDVALLEFHPVQSVPALMRYSGYRRPRTRSFLARSWPMTYSSICFLMLAGSGMASRECRASSFSYSSAMMSFAQFRCTHRRCRPRAAMSFFTSPWLLPQKEHKRSHSCRCTFTHVFKPPQTHPGQSPFGFGLVRPSLRRNFLTYIITQFAAFITATSGEPRSGWLSAFSVYPASYS